jgi:co-chaperonin GroES (HSP10)
MSKLAYFDVAQSGHLNGSGVTPIDQRVIVLPDPVETRIGSIIMPDQEVEKRKWAQAKGRLVAVGACAWAEAKATRGFFAPEPGTRVMYAKYGGVAFNGDDGLEYRIMNDEDVTGVLGEV